MANELNNTTADVLIQEIWRKRILDERVANSVLVPRVTSLDAEAKQKGDIIHVPIRPSVAVNDVGATGSLTNQALTYTEQQLTVNKWREATIDVVDKAAEQSWADMLADFSPAFARALALDQDNALTALHADFTSNEVGDSAAAVSDALLTAAIAKLLVLNVPIMNPNDVSFVFHSSKWAEFKQIDKFNNANLTGSSMGGMLTQKVSDVYGIPVYFSTAIASSTGYHNYLLHREAMAIATQSNFKIEKLARTKLSTPMVGHILYGVKTVRQDHGVDIVTA